MLHVVMPARIGSSRLPDKMVQRIGKNSLVKHAVLRVLQVPDIGAEMTFDVATDSHFIVAELAALNRDGHVVMTSANCRSGSDRCAEVANIRNWPDGDIVVDIQADMPFLNPRHVAGFLKAAARGGDWDMLTAFCDHRVVSVGIDRFRRDVVPCHVGFYAFKREALRRFASLPISVGEQALKLEQMRAVEHGFRIAYHAVPEMPFEVNTPEDLAAAQWMAECVA